MTPFLLFITSTGYQIRYSKMPLKHIMSANFLFQLLLNPNHHDSAGVFLEIQYIWVLLLVCRYFVQFYRHPEYVASFFLRIDLKPQRPIHTHFSILQIFHVLVFLLLVWQSKIPLDLPLLFLELFVLVLQLVHQYVQLQINHFLQLKIVNINKSPPGY